MWLPCLETWKLTSVHKWREPIGFESVALSSSYGTKLGQNNYSVLKRIEYILAEYTPRDTYVHKGGLGQPCVIQTLAICCLAGSPGTVVVTFLHAMLTKPDYISAQYGPCTTTNSEMFQKGVRVRAVETC